MATGQSATFAAFTLENRTAMGRRIGRGCGDAVCHLGFRLSGVNALALIQSRPALKRACGECIFRYFPVRNEDGRVSAGVPLVVARHPGVSSQVAGFSRVFSIHKSCG